MKKFFLALAIILTAAAAHAQLTNLTNLPAVTVQAEFKPNNTPVTDTTKYFFKLQVTLKDTSGIASFVVRIGSTSGAADIVEKSVPNTVGAHEGVTVTKTGKKTILLLGNNFNKLEHFYGSVRAVKNDNSETDAITFSR